MFKKISILLICFFGLKNNVVFAYNLPAKIEHCKPYINLLKQRENNLLLTKQITTASCYKDNTQQSAGYGSGALCKYLQGEFYDKKIENIVKNLPLKYKMLLPRRGGLVATADQANAWMDLVEYLYRYELVESKNYGRSKKATCILTNTSYNTGINKLNNVCGTIIKGYNTTYSFDELFLCFAVDLVKKTKDEYRDVIQFNLLHDLYLLKNTNNNKVIIDRFEFRDKLFNGKINI